MPAVRFTRDRRGYESTFLVSTSRGRGEREETRLFYWFRTPPHLKVGRAAFDEDAIRELEDGHPEVDFDWRHILAAKAPPAEPHEDNRAPRFQGRRSADAPPRTAAAPRTPPPVAARPTARSERAPISTSAQAVAEAPQMPVADIAVAPGAPPPSTPEPEETPDDMPVRRFVRVFDALPADEPPHHLSDPSASERILGIEQLGRLRGQYSAALARIGRRLADPREAERLRAIAERANPDAWVTADDVKAGLAGMDAAYAEIGRAAGRRRRRRRPQGPRPAGQSSNPAEAPGGAPPDYATETDTDDGPVDDSEGDD